MRLALKYLRAGRKSAARFTAAVAVAGIAAGVASLIVAQSLAQGFQNEMRDKILANTAHISIFTDENEPLSDWRRIAAELGTIENVREITPTAYENAALVGDAATAYALLKVNRSNTKSGVSLGVKLAAKMNLKIGDAAEILTLDNRKPTRVRVAEIFETGLYDYDATWIYVSPELFADLREQNEFVPTSLSVGVGDIFKSPATARQISEKLGARFRVVDWQEANRPLFAALGLEKKVSFAVISLIIFIAALNITTTLALLVAERRLDIAVLRTCGARTGSLIGVFFCEGMLIGAAGVAVGVTLGAAACAAGNYFKVIRLSAEVYSLDTIPLPFDAKNIALIAAAALILCAAAAIFPARRAGLVKPAENLRNR